MRSHLSDDLWLASTDDEVRLIENTGEVVRSLPLPSHATTIAQHAVLLESAMRLADELERLPIGGVAEVEEADRDTVIIRLAVGYGPGPNGGYGLHGDGGQLPDVETATQAARLAYGVPDSPPWWHPQGRDDP